MTPTTSTTTSTVSPLVKAWYVAPSGDNTKDGKTPATAWKSPAQAIDRALPGDTIVLLDGTYTKSTTGLVYIDCNGTASDGTKLLPITIKAQNERKAHLKSDGTKMPFGMVNCSWWNIAGLRSSNADNTSGSNADGGAFYFDNVSDIYGSRLLGSHNNRKFNSHVYKGVRVRRVVIEESEAYFFHRHAFSFTDSLDVVLRRVYANSMLYGAKGCCPTTSKDNENYGDEAVSFYGTNDSIAENCVSENVAGGFRIHGGANDLDPAGGGRNNKFLGSIAIGEFVGFYGGSRGTAVYNTLVENCAAINGTGNGFYFRQAVKTVFRNLTAWDNNVVGVAGDKDYGLGEGPYPDGPFGFAAVNVLASKNTGAGIGADHAFTADYSNSVGNGSAYSGGTITNAKNLTPTGMGMGAGQCIISVPNGSNMKGAGKDGKDIGANILYRYENGTLTTKPLWNADGSFPCGAIVPGVNDGPLACRNVHTRLNVATCR